MRIEMSAIELGARLILGDVKATRITAHPVTIEGGTSYQLTHFGHGTKGFGCKCCGGQAGSVEINEKTVTINSRAHHTRKVLVFVLEPADEEHMQPSERELVGDAIVALEKHLQP